MGKQEEMLVRRITEIYECVSKLPALSPSKEVNELLTELVNICIPVIAIDVSKLSSEVQAMRSELIMLCGEAEGLMESHYSDLLASYDNPLDHLSLFPYHSNYLKLSLLEYTLLMRHVPSPPGRVAFVGSGPLPLTSVVLAKQHMPAAEFHNYDLDPTANDRACRLLRGDPDMAARMAFHTADVLSVTHELRGFDVVFLAALVGIGHDEKVRVIEHLARHMAPGAILVVRSAHSARAFLYPVVEPADLRGFEVLSIHHPGDQVINSVIVSRKPQGGHAPGAAARLVQRVTEIYECVSKLPTLSPSKEVNELFTELVNICIPVIAIDVSKLSSEVQAMRSELIMLCGEAEGLLESHHSDLLASYDNPLDHLRLFPYYSNYLKLSLLEYTLLARHVPSRPGRVAFVGSGPLPLTSIVLAKRHMPVAEFHNYDLDPTANDRASRLVRSDPDMAARMAFHTADVLSVTDELRGFDVVFLAALVGVDHDEKVRVIEHLARHMAPGAVLVARSAHSARAFLYPVVEPAELTGFEVLTVHHPIDEVINSVIVARKPKDDHAAGAAAVTRPCKCCEMVQGFHHFRHGSVMGDAAPEELPS
ncbi:unnamed protein product [Musa acuminata var. zebrina]